MMSTGTWGQILKSCMSEIIFSKKESQIWDFESFLFWYKFRFFGTASGRFSQCFFKTFSSSANHGDRHFYSASRLKNKKKFFRVTNSMGALLFSHFRFMNVKLINERKLLNYCRFTKTWTASFYYVFFI